MRPSAAPADQAKSANTGVATFTGCKIVNGTNSGAYTLNAKATGLTTGLSTSFTVAGTATKLVFTTQPTNTSTGAVFTTNPVVSVEDTNNDLVTTATNQVTLDYRYRNWGHSRHLYHRDVTPNAGIATFSGCKITLSGNGGDFTLKASASGRHEHVGLSNTFTVASAATKLVFTPSRVTRTGGMAFSTQPMVTVEDVNSDVVTSNTSAVSLAITSGTGTSGAALTCTSNAPNAVAGVATFSGCAINLSGSNYTLKATQASFTKQQARPSPSPLVLPPSSPLRPSRAPAAPTQ